MEWLTESTHEGHVYDSGTVTYRERMGMEQSTWQLKTTKVGRIGRTGHCATSARSRNNRKTTEQNGKGNANIYRDICLWKGSWCVRQLASKEFTNYTNLLSKSTILISNADSIEKDVTCRILVSTATRPRQHTPIYHWARERRFLYSWKSSRCSFKNVAKAAQLSVDEWLAKKVR